MPLLSCTTKDKGQIWEETASSWNQFWTRRSVVWWISSGLHTATNQAVPAWLDAYDGGFWGGPNHSLLVLWSHEQCWHWFLLHGPWVYGSMGASFCRVCEIARYFWAKKEKSKQGCQDLQVYCFRVPGFHAYPGLLCPSSGGEEWKVLGGM